MLSNKITGRPARALIYLTGLVVLIVAAVFVLSVTGTAFSKGSMPEKGTLKGEVVAIDNGHHLETLTLRSEKIGQFPNDKLNIFLNKSTRVRICNMREPARDIKVSRNAIVSYHELQGLAVANSVSERC